jgi:hypothetical protein
MRSGTPWPRACAMQRVMSPGLPHALRAATFPRRYDSRSCGGIRQRYSSTSASSRSLSRGANLLKGAGGLGVDAAGPGHLQRQPLHRDDL